jgi:hypothetical protein
MDRRNGSCNADHKKLNYLHALIMAKDTKRVGSECLGFRARLLSRVITAVYNDGLAEVVMMMTQRLYL